MYKSVRDTLQAFSRNQLSKLNFKSPSYSSTSERFEKRSKNNNISILFKPDRSQKSKHVRKVAQALKSRRKYILHNVLLGKLVDPIVELFTPSIKGTDQLSKLSDFRTHQGFLDRIEETEAATYPKFAEEEPKAFYFNKALEVEDFISSPYANIENKTTKQSSGKWFSKKNKSKQVYKKLNLSTDLENTRKLPLLDLIFEKMIYNKIDKFVPGVNNENLIELYDFRVHKEHQIQHCADVKVTQVNVIGERMDSQFGNNLNLNLSSSGHFEVLTSKGVLKVPESSSGTDAAEIVRNGRASTTTGINLNKTPNNPQDCAENMLKSENIRPKRGVESVENSASKSPLPMYKATKGNFTSDVQKGKIVTATNPKKSQAKIARPVSSIHNNRSKTNTTTYTKPPANESKNENTVQCLNKSADPLSKEQFHVSDVKKEKPSRSPDEINESRNNILAEANAQTKMSPTKEGKVETSKSTTLLNKHSKGVDGTVAKTRLAAKSRQAGFSKTHNSKQTLKQPECFDQSVVVPIGANVHMSKVTGENSLEVTNVKNDLNCIVRTPSHIEEIDGTIDKDENTGNEIPFDSSTEVSELNASEDIVKTVLVSFNTSGDEARFVKREQLVGKGIKSELIDHNMVLDSEYKRRSEDSSRRKRLENTKPGKNKPVTKASFLAEKAKLRPWKRRNDAMRRNSSKRQQEANASATVESNLSATLPKSPVLKDVQRLDNKETSKNVNLTSQMPSKNTTQNSITKIETLESKISTPTLNRSEKVNKVVFSNHESNVKQINASTKDKPAPQIKTSVSDKLKIVQKAKIKRREEVKLEQKSGNSSMSNSDNLMYRYSSIKNVKEEPIPKDVKTLNKKEFVKLNSPIKPNENRIKSPTATREPKTNEIVNKRNQRNMPLRKPNENISNAHKTSNTTISSEKSMKRKLQKENVSQQKSKPTPLLNSPTTFSVQKLNSQKVIGKVLETPRKKDNLGASKINNSPVEKLITLKNKIETHNIKVISMEPPKTSMTPQSSKGAESIRTQSNVPNYHKSRENTNKRETKISENLRSMTKTNSTKDLQEAGKPLVRDLSKQVKRKTSTGERYNRQTNSGSKTPTNDSPHSTNPNPNKGATQILQKLIKRK
uniref:Uncharacterized protein n=1 Tax=Graphocephala atropunctata TaxID=36148 RepID=A0A1B6M3R0_9HEMI